MFPPVIFSILSTIRGQLGPNYDPLFYDVMLYIVGIVILIIIIVVIVAVSKSRKKRTKTSSRYDNSSNDDKDFSSYKKRD